MIRKKQQSREEKVCLPLFLDWFYFLFVCMWLRHKLSSIDNHEHHDQIISGS